VSILQVAEIRAVVNRAILKKKNFFGVIGYVKNQSHGLGTVESLSLGLFADQNSF